MCEPTLQELEAVLASARKRLAALEEAKIELLRLHPPAPGTLLPDGTIFVGTSPETGTPLYALPYDLAHSMRWSAAQSEARRHRFGEYTDWRLPTKAELNILYEYRERIGGFAAGWYWSATESRSSTDAWAQAFYDGFQDDGGMNSYQFRVRLVRSPGA